MYNILYLNINVFEDRKLFDKAFNMISAERQEKIKKIKNPITARLSLGAGFLLRIAMEIAGYSEYTEQIKYEKHGKPYIDDIPFHFNLSHSGEYVVCIFGNIPVGIDLQKIKCDMPKHTKRILSPDEAAYLNQQQKPEDFYRLWCKKESLIKWDGRGLKLPLYEISLIEGDQWLNQVRFEGNKIFIQEIDMLYPLYACSISSDYPIEIGKIIEIDTKILTNY